MYGTTLTFWLMLGEHFSQGIRLGRRARKAIQQGAFGAVWPAQPLADHRDRHVIRHQLAALHVPLRQFPQFGFLFQILPEDISRRDMGQTQGSEK